MPTPIYSTDEHARRGTEIYEQEIAPQIESANRGRIVAVDIESDSFEIADSGLNAANPLLARRPNAQIWCVKVGFPAVHRFSRLAHSPVGHLGLGFIWFLVLSP